MPIPLHRCIRAVVFDFDGTLTRPGALDFPAMKQKLGCPVDQPVLEYIETLADAERRKSARLALERFETDAAALSEPAPGAEALLAFLRDRRIPVAVLTRNSRASVFRALGNFASTTPTDFDLILTRDDPMPPKPHPAGVLHAADHFGVPAKEILVVGDFVFDIEAGQAAGALTALVHAKEGHVSADAWSCDVRVDGLDTLTEIIDRHLPLAAGKFPSHLLEDFFGRFSRPDPSVLIASAVGEDTAALNVAGEEVLILKSDPITFATDAIGDYAVVVNANDIATAGAVPRWLLTTLLFPCGITAAAALDILDQLRRVCDRWNITLCGGHTEITDAVSRTVVIGMMAGTVAKRRLIDKSAAGAGDRVLITKSVAVEGTAIIAREFGGRLREAGMADEEIERCKGTLADLSIMDEAAIAASAGGVTAMHDVTEGGVATALEELSVVSGHRIEIDTNRIPVMGRCRRVCDLIGIDPLGLIGSGSLLICCREEAASRIMERVAAAGIPIAQIGRLTAPGRGIAALAHGRPVPWPRFAVDEITRLFNAG